VVPIAEKNPKAAEKIAREIRRAVELLAEIPIGRPGRVQGTYEKLVVGRPYIIAYSLEPRPGTPEDLVILRIIHTARHWPPGRWPD
jgi:plasmid stabilization system protein ParE